MNNPLADTVPRRVETAAAARAMRIVFRHASISVAPPETFPVNRDLYRFMEKPVQLPRVFASVKENTAMKTSGELRRIRSITESGSVTYAQPWTGVAPRSEAASA